ncbi:Ecdysteroid kinase [Actinomadura meyerae]|uniref:Ecdysteroid kinase n=1 Tax=Actinomadura meyerae TaxID=240840 RepID=A0A239L408_9ACTN|nr:phosphotransferase [Actinomadura meyerae]SNT24563.1 Ecdysteroid kinase [Actinomadura meyerae]
MITASWLGGVLGARVGDVATEPIGTGQIGSVHRLRLTGDDVPPRLVAKLPLADPAARAMLGGAYRTEVLFYRDIAGTVAIRTPRCHHAEIDPETFEFVLLLEDLAPAVQGDQLAGCPPRRARECVEELAGLHGPRWCDASLLDAEGLSRPAEADARALAEVYAPAVETFVERFADRLGDADKDTLRGTAEGIGSWLLARPERFGLVHGDYRLDNLLFPPDGAGAPVTVDWQTLTIGLPARDLSYFLATSLDAADRRARERDLVAHYHRALLGHGVRDYPFDLCWDDYRFALRQAPLIIVLGCAYGTPTERGDAMFLAMAARACAALRDHAPGA